jgi:hypothetical protein
VSVQTPPRQEKKEGKGGRARLGGSGRPLFALRAGGVSALKHRTGVGAAKRGQGAGALRDAGGYGSGLAAQLVRFWSRAASRRTLDMWQGRAFAILDSPAAYTGFRAML